MRNLSIIFGLILIFGIYFNTHAREVESSGQATIFGGNLGSARNQALQNALRQAVEQGVGAYIDSKTITENFQIIQDEIYSVSRGFVTDYKVIEEGKNDTGDAYLVVIKANVSDKGIEEKLQALRILHKKMGNKRLMIAYVKKDPKALKRQNGSVQTTISIIRDSFNQAGFRVFNEEVMKKAYETIDKNANITTSTNTLILMAQEQFAEILVQIEMVGGKQEPKRQGAVSYKTLLGEKKSPFGSIPYMAKAIIRLQAYDTSNGRQIADVVTEGKSISAKRPGPYDWHDMLGKAGKDAGKRAASDAIERITDFYQSVGDVGFAYLFIFKNYTIEEEDLFLDYLEQTPGFKDLRSRKNIPKYLELELFSSERLDRIRRKMRSYIKNEHDIDLVHKEISGNRIVFVKQESPAP